MQLDGSKTLENLKTAISGESQARTKYTIYGELARKVVTNRLVIFSTEQRQTKRHTLNSGFHL